jgi:hypothetical protein
VGGNAAKVAADLDGDRQPEIRVLDDLVPGCRPVSGRVRGAQVAGGSRDERDEKQEGDDRSRESPLRSPAESPTE